MLQLNTANGELFALYPTNYPSILKDRVPGTTPTLWQLYVVHGRCSQQWALLLAWTRG